MRKTILVIALLSLFLISAAPENTIRLTLRNKTGMDIAVQLINGDYNDFDYLYYLNVAEGDRQYPTEKHFDIAPGIYNMQVFYLDTWDPVYGFKCDDSLPIQLNARKNMRVTVIECGREPPNWGEPTMTKFYYWVFPPWNSRTPGWLY
jgi:hypothetical protein